MSRSSIFERYTVTIRFCRLYIYVQYEYAVFVTHRVLDMQNTNGKSFSKSCLSIVLYTCTAIVGLPLSVIRSLVSASVPVGYARVPRTD